MGGSVQYGDARATGLWESTVDLIVTSPPYWKKRDYGFPEQIGQEPTAEHYVLAIADCLDHWQAILRPTGSVFLNIGDTFYRKHLAGIPGMVEVAAYHRGWILRNRIIWVKGGGMPEPAADRLANRHEYVLHLTRSDDYYYDLIGYGDAYGTSANPGDVWTIPLERNMTAHLATFPQEIVRRCIHLACPLNMCCACGAPRRRIIERTANLDPVRPQAKRAMELAAAAGLTEAHFAAIRATGISDAGKAMSTQTGTGRNSIDVQRLAAEAKTALGGYFREFTFGIKATIGWTACDCGIGFEPGLVVDPFAGTGTTLRVADEMGRRSIGVDLAATPPQLGR